MSADRAAQPNVKITLRLYCGEEIAMGPGKADLLETIRTCGSISAASRVLGMSYRRAWLLVDTMNRCWKEPLVTTTPGSAAGAGARLTEYGTNILSHYRALQAGLEGCAECGERTAMVNGLLAKPKARQQK